ncbi:MAG TPA: HPr family phosphocarrier protein [Ruminococcaceae bacterium]|jgi:phosphotransferase system HPr-like phosphotransfer protein|nr:HPr family phosphocarrier protein [Oscillospiraceae bacterium]HBG55598.1 HPr family phosphocarrier protein [Oscillospiraceae bacterium]HBQ47034.1 HPr family phosphocarrier protein [Oscillospiraceae bacterium]HBT91344.1 HPr family phosphocarrier protein [Oscillospiraceae bacterium]HCB91242.1 HPr family phosphocarrier protein [Oscillospiraceae bacterium]
MYTASILLSSIEAVKKFVTLTNRYDFPISLSTDRYDVDAKSIMGIFSLDLSKPLRVEAHSEDPERAEDFLRRLQPFCVEQVSSQP